MLLKHPEYQPLEAHRAHDVSHSRSFLLTIDCPDQITRRQPSPTPLVMEHIPGLQILSPEVLGYTHYLIPEYDQKPEDKCWVPLETVKDKQLSNVSHISAISYR